LSAAERSPDEPGAVFAALADPTRRRVLALVGERGPMSATDLAAHVTVSRQAVVKHLGVLRAAGLVDASREGRETLYRVTPAPLGEAQQWLADAGARWDRRLADLQRRVAERRR
jgi:DNA-binding transcriptional ArsR family regulator